MNTTTTMTTTMIRMIDAHTGPVCRLRTRRMGRALARAGRRALAAAPTDAADLLTRARR